MVARDALNQPLLPGVRVVTGSQAKPAFSGLGTRPDAAAAQLRDFGRVTQSL